MKTYSKQVKTAFLFYLLIQFQFVQVMAQKVASDKTIAELRKQLNKEHNCYKVNVKTVSRLPIDLKERDTAWFYYDVYFKDRKKSQDMVVIGENEQIVAMMGERFNISDSSARKVGEIYLSKFLTSSKTIDEMLKTDESRAKYSIIYSDTFIDGTKYKKVLFVEKIKKQQELTIEPTANARFYVFNSLGIKEIHVAVQRLGFNYHWNWHFDYCKTPINQMAYNHLSDSLMQVWYQLDSAQQVSPRSPEVELKAEEDISLGEMLADSAFFFKLNHQKFKTYGGDEFAFNELQSRFVFIDLWYVSCYPCMVSFTEMKEIYEYCKTTPLVDFLAINVYDNENRIKFIVDKFKKAYPITMDTAKVFTKEFNFTNYPAFLLVDKVEQKVVFYQLGYSNKGPLLERLKEEIEKHDLKE